MFLCVHGRLSTDYHVFRLSESGEELFFPNSNTMSLTATLAIKIAALPDVIEAAMLKSE